MPNEMLRQLPSIESVLSTPQGLRLSAELNRDLVRDLLRRIMEELREELTNTDSTQSLFEGRPILDEIEKRLSERARALLKPSLRRVINATGVILHTNLGHAPLASKAAAAVSNIVSGYSNLEYDLDKGARGRRESHLSDLVSRLCGSEAAIVTNNNAAAVLLVLNTLAEGGEVLVSRGELIEIGGSFRIPEIMEKSGAVLREVGTTNRTRIADYEQAVTDKTRLILRVHPSNYRIIGFTERPSASEIAELASRHRIDSFEDLGSGCLIDLSPYGIKDEPVVSASLKAGISVASFSGDKMLGGPQAGIIAGSRSVVDRVSRNPLMRALRVDKMTYAALEATLRLYECGKAEFEVPVIKAMAASQRNLQDRASVFCSRFRAATNGIIDATIEEGESIVGGGSAPGVGIPTPLITLRGASFSAASLESGFRSNDVPILTRLDRECVIIDLRTVEMDEEEAIINAAALIASSAAKTMASAKD